MLSGISHITLIVSDLNKTAVLFKKIFDAEEVYASGSQMFSVSKEIFLTIGDLWFCIMEGESLSERTYNHIALKIDDSDYEMYLSRIANLGLDKRPDRPRINGEGRSIYFYDYDNHLFELHTGTLAVRLNVYSNSILH